MIHFCTTTDNGWIFEGCDLQKLAEEIEQYFWEMEETFTGIKTLYSDNLKSGEEKELSPKILEKLIFDLI